MSESFSDSLMLSAFTNEQQQRRPQQQHHQQLEGSHQQPKTRLPHHLRATVASLRAQTPGVRTMHWRSCFLREALRSPELHHGHGSLLSYTAAMLSGVHVTANGCHVVNHGDELYHVGGVEPDRHGNDVWVRPHTMGHGELSRISMSGPVMMDVTPAAATTRALVRPGTPSAYPAPRFDERSDPTMVTSYVSRNGEVAQTVTRRSVMRVRPASDLAVDRHRQEQLRRNPSPKKDVIKSIKTTIVNSCTTTTTTT
eukprot:PhM_4_TR7130/c1_g1_i1/m.34918